MENLIGKGVLNWRRGERVSDRYGTVCLYSEVGGEETKKLKRYHGYGKLVAIVKETRASTHIGDMFRGIFPETPKVGETIELGEGYIFYDIDEYGEMVGLKPRVKRDSDWLNPKNLYRLHEQTVELYYERVFFPEDSKHKKVK